MSASREVGPRRGSWVLRASGMVALAVVAAVAGCGRGGGAPGKQAQITLTGAGASFPYPLYSKWIAEYQKASPRVRINYQSIGSGGGIQQLKAGTVDFAASDAPLSDEELRDMPGPVVHIPTVAGAVAVVYHLPGAKRPLRLGPETLADICLGRITRWNDPALAALNPGLDLPDMPITVVHRSDGSGTTYIFTHYLAAVSGEWAQQVGAGKSVSWPAGVGAKGNEGVAGAVKQTPGAVGYVEVAYAVQNQIPYAEVRNAAGRFISPTLPGIAAAAAGAAKAMEKEVRVSIVNSPAPEAYPISGFTYLLAYRHQKDARKGEALRAFLRWAMGEGQRYAEPLLYAPLPASVVEINRKAVEGISAGSEGPR